ncbi:hypothetical protein EV356DRAFT_175212 [Viridothelium virens]|uniref:Impact N-terminal domain-containing protein n=1 Tax=Viridothelium virens TaxID=1048519 RepID=A0A6A6H8K8_VIRVR|nr:hypothetical protein EV356DRAFT_175212 [Viridothelium virens]
MSLKRKRTPSPPPIATGPSDVFRSDSIYDRSSTFVAHFSSTIKPKDLQSSKEFESASHRILGWRRTSNQRSLTGSAGSQQLYVTGSDDDGEKYGGKRLEKVLEAEQVEGAVVVARWYGGVLLGPIRFTHIEICAKEAIHRWKEAVAETAEKKRRLEADEHERNKLVNVLRERDQSISTLRGLLAEKESTASKGTDSSANPPTPTKSLDYDSMPLQSLKTLERARDASIGFLLKKIDQAEERHQQPQLLEGEVSQKSTTWLPTQHITDEPNSCAPATHTASKHSNDIP